MNPRVRKKKPPDPLLSSFDLQITSSFLVDLAMSLLMHRFPFPAIPFPCPLLDPTLPSETRFYQIDSRVQSTTRRFRSQSESATILDIFWVPNLSGCCGLLGSTHGISSVPLLMLFLHVRGPGSVMFERTCPGWQVRSIACGCDGLAGENLPDGGPSSALSDRCCQDWRICSVSDASARPPSHRPPQVSATSLPISYYSNGLF